jgi:hypothetical protein
MMQTKKRLIIASGLVCFLAAAGVSNPGRATLKAAFTGIAALVATGPDVEERARASHGWSSQAVTNSLVLGTMIYYDGGGREVRRYAMRLYRKYPERLRMELERQGMTFTVGFDGLEAWRAGASQISEEEARDIRQLLRATPERFFIRRAAGGRYREVGRISDERSPLNRHQNPEMDEPPMDQVEIEDLIGPAAGNGRSRADLRQVYCLVNSESSVVSVARWLEPTILNTSPDDPNNPKLEVRIDFTSWNNIGGLLWPFEVIHQRGGRVDYRIEVIEVRVNQQMPDTMFQNPGR